MSRLSLGLAIVLSTACLQACQSSTQLPPAALRIVRVDQLAPIYGPGDAEFSCTFEAGAEPVDLSWDFGGGADPNILSTSSPASPAVQNASCVAVGQDTEFTLTVTLARHTAPQQSVSIKVPYTVKARPWA